MVPEQHWTECSGLTVGGSIEINAEHNQRQHGIGSKDECYRSSEKAKNYMDSSDQGTWMEEVSLGY